MKIKSLLLLAAFWATSWSAMAQTTITAGSVNFVPFNGAASLTYYYTNAETMGGFQMVVSLPDGVTLEEDAEKTANGLSINGGEAAKGATFYNVTVPSGFECIGVKADADGTTSDGTAYKKGDVLLVCFPVKAGAEYKGTTTASLLCTLNLTTSEGITRDALKTVAINGFAGSDTNGTGGADVAAKYAASTESIIVPVAIMKPDVNNNGEVDALDIQDVITTIVADEFTDAANVNGDEYVDALDIQDIITIIVNS